MSFGRWWLLVIIAVAVIALALAGLVAFQTLRREPMLHEEPMLSKEPRYPWLFKGAYGVYEGEAVLGFTTMTVKLRVEVLDFNSTHVRWRYELSADGLTDSIEEWVELGKLRFSAWLVKKLVKEEERGRYEKAIAIPIHKDIPTGWILQIDYKDEVGNVSITVRLKETNIPGLRELVSG